MGARIETFNFPSDEDVLNLPQDELLKFFGECKQRITHYESLLFRLRKSLFGIKSEKSESSTCERSVTPTLPALRGETTKLPSERYPEANILSRDVNFKNAPSCQACGSEMRDSGLTEDSEFIEVRDKEFLVVQQRRHKHRCPKCHSSIVTTPSPARIIPQGSYGDGLIIDVAVTKYCDLIPIERYCAIAGRSGFLGLPSHSLIQTTVKLAYFFKGIYELIKAEVLAARVMMADETPHRMLEGDAKTAWFLWAFLCEKASYFECQDTRSGDVSTAMLEASSCEVLLTDVYRGYSKSLRIVNNQRVLENKPLIEAAYCNAHARREFKNCETEGGMPEDAQAMVDSYGKAFAIEAEAKLLATEDEKLKKRQEIVPIFESMREDAQTKIETYSNKSQMSKAYNYFLKNYEGLSLFLKNPLVAMDNNQSERSLRSHVVGRKTWYGTHSREGARTAAIHFTINETCKLNKVNPREYYHVMTPSQYKTLKLDTT